MSHKLEYEKAPAENLKVWANLQKIISASCVVIAVVLLGLFFVFVY